MRSRVQVLLHGLRPNSSNGEHTEEAGIRLKSVALRHFISSHELANLDHGVTHLIRLYYSAPNIE
jgi:hypothetical protein